MLKPFSVELNAAILELAPAFTVRDEVPSTFPQIMAAPGIVWSGGSDATIYGDARVNWAFRAWHDATHCTMLYDFSFAGEAMTCEAQIAELLQRYPNAPALWPAILRAEVIGQALHYQQHGQFPEDQRAFVRRLLTNEGYHV